MIHNISNDIDFVVYMLMNYRLTQFVQRVDITNHLLTLVPLVVYLSIARYYVSVVLRTPTLTFNVI
jgi:hypothetical protein